VTGPWAAVVAVGNPYRRDDGAGLAALAALRASPPAAPSGEAFGGVRLAQVDGEPTRLLDAWDGVRLAVVVDAATSRPAQPGRIHRAVFRAGVLESGPGTGPGAAGASSHGLGLPEAVELGRILGRLPDRLVLLTVEAGDVGYGDGLTPAVEAALPELVRAIRTELAVSGPG
jgi:hydrogenase maturation protease